MNLLPGLLALAACGTSTDGPHLEAVSPPVAHRNVQVTLAGTGFCPRDCAVATGEILIGLDLPQTQAIVIAYDDVHAVIQIPEVAPFGDTALVLVVDGRSSNALDFRIDE